MGRTLWAVAVCLLLVGCDDNSGIDGLDRDNTAVNQRDRDDSAVTPLDQSNQSADIDQVAAIRKAVLDIDDLSVNGRNVKIITGEGRVILRGPVASQAERRAIEQATAGVVGDTPIINELEVENR